MDALNFLHVEYITHLRCPKAQMLHTLKETVIWNRSFMLETDHTAWIVLRILLQ